VSRNSARNIALAMSIGVVLVLVLYLFTNLAYLNLITVDEMILSEVPVMDAISAANPGFGSIIPLIIMISAAGTIAAFTLAAPRMYQSMAADGLFFPLFGKKHRRFHTPVNAIVTQSAWAVFWVLFWGDFCRGHY
jgi:basic amino acid/polyamine antiporter, APA family